MKRILFLLFGALSGFFVGSFYLAIFNAFLLYKIYLHLYSDYPLLDMNRFYLIRSMSILMTAIAKADGIYKKSELAYIKQFLKHYFQMEQPEFLWYLKDLKHLAFSNRLPVRKSIYLLNKYAHQHEKKFFIHCACELAAVDNHIPAKEKKVINFIAQQLGISAIEMNRIWDKYKVTTNKYFQILGVRPDTPLEIIRKRYYELAKFFHPDKFRHRNLQDQRFAERKMKEINEAWNQILKMKQVQN